MTIEIDPEAIKTAALWLLGAILLGAALARAEHAWTAYSHRRWAERQSGLDRRQDEDRRRLDADRDRAERERNPLPGPALAGECARRLTYADACDLANRPREADRQRGIAGQLGALSQLAASVGEDPDREDWSRELAGAYRLVAARLLPVPGWVDPGEALGDNPEYAEMGTHRWNEAVAALAEAVRTNMQADDFGPGMMGRGVLTSAHSYGYAAAPELARSTVEAFLRDWCLALHGEPAEQTWPVDLPERDPSRMMRVRLGDGDDFLREIIELRSQVDAVLRPLDIRGLYGRGKSELIGEIRERFGTPRLTDDLVEEFVSDYMHAITGQEIRHPDRWANQMPDTDESRVLPLRHELQPADVLAEMEA